MKIIEMSHKSKSKIIQELGYNSDNIEFNITALVVYGKDCPAYEHWIDELVAWISNAGDKHDSIGRKFTEQDYENNLFVSCGTTTNDAQSSLYRVKKKAETDDKYDDFEITRSLTNKVYCASQSIKNEISEYLSKLKRYEKCDKQIIRTIINNELDDVI